MLRGLSAWGGQTLGTVDLRWRFIGISQLSANLSKANTIVTVNQFLADVLILISMDFRLQFFTAGNTANEPINLKLREIIVSPEFEVPNFCFE